jgi:hypothetical protein
MELKLALVSFDLDFSILQLKPTILSRASKRHTLFDFFLLGAIDVVANGPDRPFPKGKICD